MKGYKNEVNENRSEIAKLRLREKEFKKRNDKENYPISTFISNHH